MNKNDFLSSICGFTEEAVQDLLLPVSVQTADDTESRRAAKVYKMRLPDSKAAAKKVPYIIHSVITASDSQPEGEKTSSSVQLRSVFAVYCEDEQEGALMLLELIDRYRIPLLRTRVLNKRYVLDLTEPMDAMIYTDDTAPYFMGEMVSRWYGPSVEREVSEWLQ